MSHRFEEILVRAQRVRHEELKRLFGVAAGALADGANRLIRSAAAPIEATRVSALARLQGPEDRPGC